MHIDYITTMAVSRAPSIPLLRSLRALTLEAPASRKCLSSSPPQREEAQVETRASFYQNPDPETVFIPRLEKRLAVSGRPPIGSRRRRQALFTSPNVPFSELPYQCFQEARKILIADREEKLEQIEVERVRLARLQATEAQDAGEEAFNQRRLKSMSQYIEKLKILADINDPLVKKRFEDGLGVYVQSGRRVILTFLGDMNKPIYRYLAERKWREYRRRIQLQRITQMKVIPDVIPACDPTADLTFSFGGKTVPPGEFVDSSKSTVPPSLNVQTFDRGEKLITVIVINPDVPNVETDSFEYRCHFLAANIPISPTSTSVDLAKISTDSQVILPWYPAFVQKGAPYHRMSIIVFQHKNNTPIDVEMARARVKRNGLTARSLMSRHQMLTPIAAQLFRTIWDDNTAAVMAQIGVEGAELELKRVRVEPLPYKRRNPSSFR